MKYPFARSFDRQKRGVYARAAALGDCVQADVDSGAGSVGSGGALIETRGDVSVAQQNNCEAAAVEFMAQQSRKSQGDVFLGQFIRQGTAPFLAAMGGIEPGRTAMDNRRLRRRGLSRTLWRSLRSRCNDTRRSIRRRSLGDGGNDDRPATIGEACYQWVVRSHL